MLTGLNRTHEVECEFALLWKLSKLGKPSTYLFGNIYSTHPLVTNMRGSLNEQLSNALSCVEHVFTEFAYPISYKVQHVLVVPSQNSKTCAKRNFKNQDTYHKICQILENAGYVLTQSNPKQNKLEPSEINLDFILLKDMAYLLTSIELAVKSHNSHDMRIVRHATLLKKTLHAFESITSHVDSYGLEDNQAIEEYLEETCSDLIVGLSEKQQAYIAQETEFWINGRTNDIVKTYDHSQFQTLHSLNNHYVFEKLKLYFNRSFLAVVGIGELKGLLNLFKQEGYTLEAIHKPDVPARIYAPMLGATRQLIAAPTSSQIIPARLQERLKP
jgi:hypothetical protein